MRDGTSDYQAFKIWLAGYVPVDRDWLHVLFGLFLVILALAATRRQWRLGPFVLALIAAVVLGVAMEMADRFDDIRTHGAWRWRESLADILRTAAVPLVSVVTMAAVFRRGIRK